MKLKERLSWPLSTSTLSQVSQGGGDRAAEHAVPEQLTVTGPCCREAEPSRRTREQPPASDPPPEQSDTDTDREEQNSGTYTLKHTPRQRTATRNTTKGLPGKPSVLEACRFVWSGGLMEDVSRLQDRSVHRSPDGQLRLEEVGAGQEALRANTGQQHHDSNMKENKAAKECGSATW